MKLQLNDVTLCAADSVTVDLTIRAIEKTIEICNFKEVILFTDQSIISTDSYKVIPIERLRSIDDYSYFVMKKMNSHINTKYALLIQ